MSFLTPLYLFGALAVGLPLLFHLIRRTPRGRQVFSSLMFLEPSPPRVTRRSRIEDWLLLCLRALAICLLAAAFARPFWRQPSAAETETGNGRWIAVLLDTSASMRREGLWDEALDRVTSILQEAAPDDRIALYTFDASPQQRFGWDAWRELDPGQRAAAFEGVVSELTPGWRETDLGRALVVAADSLEDAATQDRGEPVRQIMLISDLQSGSRLEALQAYAWPETVKVQVDRVGADVPRTNAAVHVVTGGERDDGLLRVRVTNAADSERETFRLVWRDEFSQPSTTSPVEENGAPDGGLDVYVVPGQSRVVAAPEQPTSHPAARLVLDGDEHAFDNVCYVTRSVVRDVTIVILSSEDPADPAEQRFYLEPMFPDTADRSVQIVDWDFESSRLPDAEHGIQLVVLTDTPRPDQVAALQEYARDGGLIWLILRAGDDGAALYELAGAPPVPATEADVADYTMLTALDFEHPILAPFADPRYSDFTKLRFWRHRSLDLAPLADVRVLARFDDGEPALGEIPVGAGRVLFMASGWNRADSQLALWSKFVPMANALLEYAGGPMRRQGQFVIGDEISLATLTGRPDEYTQLRSPDGDIRPLTAGTPSVVGVDEPGMYALLTADDAEDRTIRFAVNLPPSESRTDPLSSDALEAAGVRLSAAPDSAVAAANADRQRQRQNHELEQQQKLWRWLLIAAVAVLVAETLLGGVLSRTRRGTV